MRSMVTIGMPVFNGEKYLIGTLESLLSQTYEDFVLIISDNASTDDTEAICREYANKDKRIDYIRQDNNIGPGKNFKFLYDSSDSNYFMWNAADDRRTSEFISDNLYFLENNHDYIASTYTNCYEGEENILNSHVKFSIEGSLYERYETFLKNCWQTHAIFYALFRKSALSDFDYFDMSTFAADWFLDTHLIGKGQINRIDNGLLILGKSGESMAGNVFKKYRKKPIEHIFPLYDFSCYFSGRVFQNNDLSNIQKIKLLVKIININLRIFIRRTITFFK